MLLVTELRRCDGTHLQPVLNDVSGEGIVHLRGAWPYDQQLLPFADDGLEHRLYLQHVTNLVVRHQDVHVLKDTLVLLLVVNEQLVTVPSVYLNAVCGLAVCGLAHTLLHGDQAVLPNLAVCVGNDATDDWVVVGGDGRYVLNLPRADLARALLQ